MMESSHVAQGKADPLSRRSLTFLGAAIVTGFASGGAGAADGQSDKLPPGVTPAPPQERRVSIGYALWHYDEAEWKTSWGHPVLGHYSSGDPAIMRKHGEWLSDAGVDFILVDWSNSLGADDRTGAGNPRQILLEQWTKVLFDTWCAMPRKPLISIMIGNPLEAAAVSNGHLQAKADQVFEEYVKEPRYRALLEMYLGKPLLVVYVNTPTPYQNGVPTWSDPRFTVRWMTGFVTDQLNLVLDGEISRFGYWSWEDRGRSTFPIFQGHPEAMTAVAAWRNSAAHPTQGRRNGETFRGQWARARAIGPRFVLAGTFNEWRSGEQPSADVSKDIEPSTEFGDQYLGILKHEAARFKAGD
jgi:hypothetical protein